MSRRVGTLGRAAVGLAWAAATASAQTVPAGTAARGAAIVASRSEGLCLLCHRGPGVPAHLQGTLAPDLAGVGSRLSAEALRQRLRDPQRFNPDSIMPAYGPTTGLQRVAPAWQGRPLLDEQQIEDVVAYLQTLR